MSLTFSKVYFTFEKKIQTLQKIDVLFVNKHLLKFIKFCIQTNSNKPKVYYSDVRHQFYIKLPSLALRPCYIFEKIPNMALNWKDVLWKMTVNVSIFYQNSGLTPSKLYYSNTRCHFHMNSTLPPTRAILHLRKNANVLYQNLDLTQSKVYYSNAINQFCMSWALLSLGSILHLRMLDISSAKVTFIFFRVCYGFERKI